MAFVQVTSARISASVEFVDGNDDDDDDCCCCKFLIMAPCHLDQHPLLPDPSPQPSTKSQRKPPLAIPSS